MEEQLSPLAVTHLLQHTLRSLCIHENSQWVYAVFWRILPRNYPPPKWDGQGAYDRSRGNRRNWILVWEDGFCNFAASTAEMNSGECPSSSSSAFPNCEFQQYQGLQPELFFKMSHEIYNYGEGIIGKVAADRSHKWIYKEPNDQEINFLSPWHSSADSHPRTWEAQFQSGIKTIALIAVREGVVQLGAVNKVMEDLSYVVLLRKKFSYIESIPGVLLPHPSSAAFPYKVDGYLTPEAWHYHQGLAIAPPTTTHDQFYGDHFNGNGYQAMPFRVTPSMSSLEALLSKLPSVVPPHSAAAAFDGDHHGSQGMINPGLLYNYLPIQRPMELLGIEKVAKEEVEDDDNNEGDGGRDINHHPPQEYHHGNRHVHDVGESSSSMAAYLSSSNFLNTKI